MVQNSKRRRKANENLYKKEAEDIIKLIVNDIVRVKSWNIENQSFYWLQIQPNISPHFASEKGAQIFNKYKYITEKVFELTKSIILWKINGDYVNCMNTNDQNSALLLASSGQSKISSGNLLLQSSVIYDSQSCHSSEESEIMIDLYPK